MGLINERFCIRYRTLKKPVLQDLGKITFFQVSHLN